MIYKIMIEQKGQFVDAGETVECTFEETQAITDDLQSEQGCCVALELVSE